MLNPFDVPVMMLDVSDLTKVWRGDLQEPYAVASVVGTIAGTLRAMGKADTTDDAQTMTQDLWDARDRDFLSGRP